MDASKKLKCASFFSGVGGIDLGFESTGFFETVYANEIDKFPIKTFEANFPLKVDCRDIKNVRSDEIPNFDILLAGFPCQAFSVAGYREGFDDKKGRGVLFFELLRIIKDKKPTVLFLENVKNLVSHNNGNTVKTILTAISREGYFFKYKVLNASEYGNVPQNRERIYIVAFKDAMLFERFEFPNALLLSSTIKDVIDFNNEVDNKYYYTDGKYKGDIFQILCSEMTDENSVYQWRRKYVRRNKNGLIPTLTANSGEGGHNVPIVKTQFGIRKMTPRECFNAQGFPSNFVLPSDLADGKLYKQAGNSVCVSVIKRIAENIAKSFV